MFLRICLAAGVAGMFAMSARANEPPSGDGCTGYIESVPISISRPGVWCLSKDFSSRAVPGGAAIVIRADDVTLDCRGHRIEASLQARRYEVPGIVALDRNNVVVRDCDIRKFWIGILVSGGRGHVVERNLVEDSAFMGIWMPARASEILQNRILDTGGDADSLISLGIGSGGAHIRDNTVEGLLSPGGRRTAQASGSLVGIWPGAGSVSGNRVQQAQVEGTDQLYGILTFNGPQRLNVHDNDLIGPGRTGIGVECWTSDTPSTFVAGNRINGFGIAVRSDCVQGQNQIAP
jgi:hypothetical protein